MGEITSIKYKVEKIDGDYAHLKDMETGGTLLIARAFIPEEADEGDTLLWENFVYTLI